MAVGGAAYLVSKAITRLAPAWPSPTWAWKPSTSSTCKDMPVTVAVDSKGTSVHQTGPAEWQQRIAGIPILQ